MKKDHLVFEANPENYPFIFYLNGFWFFMKCFDLYDMNGKCNIVFQNDSGSFFSNHQRSMVVASACRPPSSRSLT